ncbi:YjaG family protein [Pseudidiomarina gelatinasegens]|uniref:YjaG family protein n=1 Tax=Pseudidiomarina gelatinasegens TaxID=2487740 RepID=UPI0030EE4D6A
MVLNTFDRIRALPMAYQTVMALYLCQRMVPNYELFHHVTGFGDPKPLHGALNACWDWVWQEKSVKVNFARWQEKVDDVTPSEHGHDMLGVYPAMDACTAISTLLQGLLDQNSADLVSVAKVSQAGVAKFLELTEGAELDAQERRKLLREHELVQYEIEVQQAILNYLETVAAATDKPTKELVSQVRAMVTDEGVSNIGVNMSDENVVED